MNDRKSVEPINTLDYLEELLGKGYVIKGPRKDPSRDLISFKAFLKRERNLPPKVGCHIWDMNS